MPTRLNRTRKDQERWVSFSGRLISRIDSAEDYGLIDEAEALECTYNIVRDVWLENNLAVNNRLYRYFGAPEDSVDLQKELNKPAYRRHLTSPLPSATPPALRRYIEARNDRVRKFEIWRPSDAVAQIVAHLVRGSPAPGKGADRALDQAMAARRKEIQALSQAIERCHAVGLATTRSASEFGQGLLSDLSFIPWQLGHAYLLRDITGGDLETTREQRQQLREVIIFLRAQKT